MLGEWFRKVKEEEQEEVFYSCRMISIDVYFQEPRVKITQDNHRRSNTIISTYNLARTEPGYLLRSMVSWGNERIKMSSKLAYPYPEWIVFVTQMGIYSRVPPIQW